MQSETSVNVVPISATIRADQRDRLVSFAKHSGAISLSEALRFILDDWVALKRAAIQAARPAEWLQEQAA